MTDLSLDDYCQSAITASPILTDEDVLGTDKTRPPVSTQGVYLYCHRIASYCARDLYGKVPETDESDWIDAIQECSLAAPQIVASWRLNPTHKFASYASRAFRNIISNYLWTQAKGGTGSWRTAAELTTELPDEYYAAVDSNRSESGAYVEAPFGLRDPFEEVAAMQLADRLCASEAYAVKTNRA